MKHNKIYLQNNYFKSILSKTLLLFAIDTRISFSEFININASKCSWDNEFLNLLKINFNFEKERWHATSEMDRVNIYLYAFSR
jgi:hypothetical protein